MRGDNCEPDGQDLQQSRISTSLTPREIEVLGLVARGKSARQIGEILAISFRAVQVHVSAAGKKLGAANKTHAVVIALRDRIIPL